MITSRHGGRACPEAGPGVSTLIPVPLPIPIPVPSGSGGARPPSVASLALGSISRSQGRRLRRAVPRSARSRVSAVLLRLPGTRQSPHKI